jgi:hypothetical protein
MNKKLGGEVVTDIGKAQGKVKAGGFCRHAIWPASEV